ncbi:DNase I-like protein [Vararia minispora EC-137]|uniref:DNase I-like protein n=1 Tax=Vararia minispora EC-137 TaxID=1314806 RepID=A0ACB8QRX9_9AGAM|nr:DNase I-like protein [Vararia minispora EC-137]
MHLYLKESPRTIYLVTSSQEEINGRPSRALVLRAAEHDPSRAVVEFLRKEDVDLNNVTRLTSRIVKGCLGLISVGKDMFVAFITSATEVGNVRPTIHNAEIAAKIHEVTFFCMTSSAWDFTIAPGDTLPSPTFADNADVMSMRDVRDLEYQSNGQATALEHPCAPLTKILSSGTFYYAMATDGAQWDISTRLPVRVRRDQDSPQDSFTFDGRFVWNEYIARSLLDFRDRLDTLEKADFDRCQFLVLAIQGYVGIFTVALPALPTNGTPVVATIALISRLGYRRAGTRFNTRGVDDDGNTANFVETETLLSTDQHTFSYVQVRGSVPLFWEQQGLQTFGQKIQITRPHASQPAFERHFSQLTDEYGSVYAVNLLGTKDHEASLTAAYSQHLQRAKSVWGDDIGIAHFDFHNVVRVGGHESLMPNLRRIEGIVDNTDHFGFTMCDATSEEIITEQKGVFRTNCLDCLDRTNFVQDIMSRSTLEQYLSLVRREWAHSNSLWTYHRELWAENGDSLSRIYAGTGALNTSFTRTGKRTLGGLLSDATKSVSRAYINNFQDKSKQVAIDMFLGNLSDQRQVAVFDPVHDTVRAALDVRIPEYSSTSTCSIFVGTWNLNGRQPPSESLLPWLCPRDTDHFLHCSFSPDMIVLGFQEIVPLTAQQIVQTDPEKKRLWENKILETLDQRPNTKADYVLLRSQQLVGTALIVLVRNEHLAFIRGVEATTRKTGLRGMSGNKGAVGIRLEFHDTSFCFLTAHLAAGHNNVEERNADYHTISEELHFLRGKSIDSHDNVIWLADTNYRIDLDNETVRELALSDRLDELLAADQLKYAIDIGAVFPGYFEGPILFRPTYRYDVGTDDYDTSEKMRIPAWTDRILYKGSHLDLSVYSRAELRGSDHKPVYAFFRATVRIVDHAKKETLSRLLTESVTSTAPGEKLEEKLAALTFAVENDELPLPSSETAAWWDTAEHPQGVVPIAFEDPPLTGNPWDSDSPLSASPSSSDEALFNSALGLQTPLVPTKKSRPPPPPRKPTGQSAVILL